MITWINKRLRNEGGFTLIELMVVVLIIAILIAIAIPTFLGARRRAQDRAAQSTARNVLTAAKTIFSDTEDYTGVSQTALDGSEPTIDFVSSATSSDDPNEASWNVPTTTPLGTTFVVSVYSKSGRCFWIQDVAGPTAAPGLGTEFSSATSDGTDCTAGTVRGTLGPKW